MLRLWARALSLGVVIVLLLTAGSRPAPAQSPFASCLNATSGNATIIIPASAQISINDRPIALGDEIAAVDAHGQCVGHLTWSGTGSEALTVWEAGLFHDSHAGLHPGDPITLYVWMQEAKHLFTPENSTLSIRLDTSAPHLHNTLRYERNGMYVVEALIIEPEL